MSTSPAKPRLLGAHTSIAGGVENSLLEGSRIGATTVQIFTANQRQWHAKPISAAHVAAFLHKKEELGLSHIMSHASYLVNLGSPDPDLLARSRAAFREEILRCQALGISYLNFHPGAALESDRQSCLERVTESLLSMRDLLDAAPGLRLLIETTAGQGSVVGVTFEEIGYMVRHTSAHLPIGVCIDTCHIFAAGYDIRTPSGWEQVLDAYDRQVGADTLYAFHLNDSKQPFGSRKDRHAPLGEGEIGLESFRYLVTHPRLCHLPKYLETPGGPELWQREIAMMREW